jgi:peroxiredoxin
MEAFRDHAAGFAEANAQVLGVSVDSFAAAEAFRKDLGCDFPLLGDWPFNRTGEAYGVYDPERHITRRVTFVLDKDHVVRAIIDDPRDMERHAREALEEVRKLGAGASSP